MNRAIERAEEGVAPAFDLQDDASFAHFTFCVRIPRIVGEVAVQPGLTAESRTALEAARAAPLDVRVERITLPPEEARLWSDFFARYEGRRVAELPFYEAEAFFYLHILALSGALESGWDPYAETKRRDFVTSKSSLEALTARMTAHRGSLSERLSLAVAIALGGNRFDLSQLAESERPSALTLLHQETGEAIAAALADAEELVYLVDNAFSELWCDLLLLHTMLESFTKLRARVIFKPRPAFVSDATLSDLDTLWQLVDEDRRLPVMQDAAEQIKLLIERGRIRAEAWPAMNAPLHFTSPHFEKHFDHVELKVLKGDANYRRAFEDRRWPADYAIERACARRVMPALFLRVLKSECMLGLSGQRAAELDAQDAAWKTNGKYAVVQLVLADLPSAS